MEGFSSDFLVAERIEFVEKLLILKEDFSESNKFYAFNEYEGTHPFRHYSGLINYLCLTCFDMLGSDNYLDFSSWLSVKKPKYAKVKKEREIIFSEIPKNLKTVEQTLYIHSRYNEIYSVKKSFMNFIREVLSSENKKKLFNSINGSKRIKEYESWEDETGKKFSRPPIGENYVLSDIMKENFLYKLRNDFTHSGKTIGSPAFFTFQRSVPIQGQEIFPFETIYTEELNGDRISYTVSNWPAILIDIVKSTIDFERLLSERYEK